MFPKKVDNVPISLVPRFVEMSFLAPKNILFFTIICIYQKKAVLLHRKSTLEGRCV